ncbi:VanZ family protein [Microbacterium sp. BK668]|uniref:VanZ family protein n=1 Tax=Microbacterium sp. BK668 TaxID=2512118 RepID=UPI00105F8A85|nr:VanZ family protein [Microbacterium sp. BK668]TDN92081.1 VanZ like protein [Microbacterium sp. BK668]
MRQGGSALRRNVLLAALAAYAVFVCLITLSPRTPGDSFVTRFVNDALAALHARGLLLQVDYLTVEFFANTLLFVPLGALTTAVLDRRWWWTLLVAGTAFSGLLELVQLLLLPDRVADWRDLVSNTIGFLLGAAAVVIAGSAARRRAASSVPRQK